MNAFRFLHMSNFKCRFTSITQAAILYNIKNRHIKGLPYTRTGDMVVAVNPYQWFDDLYTEEKRALYANRLVWSSSEEDPRVHLAPHVYETSALAYKGMAFEGQNQSILVSGESGAGKTETVKICMNHIASVQEGPTNSPSSSESAIVVERVLDSNPLLEAFGNAKTRRNDNSSRFGKYTQLQFDRKDNIIGHPVSKLAGSKCEVYLLEKNRVVNHDSEERTFHIFYQLLAAPDDTKASIWSDLKGMKNEDYKYVGPTPTDSIEGVTDRDQFQKTLDILKLIGLGKTEIRSFLRSICCVLQLGNISYSGTNGDNDKSMISSNADLSKLAGLMDISEEKLSVALTERTMKTRDESYKVPLNTEQASESSDALAKEIYGKVFLWLVSAINKATCAEENYNGGQIGKQYGIIGLLDIFGFESFSENRFEQLCINYANEKLQQKFTEDIFKTVLAEYKEEGIPLAEIKYDDNTDVLDLIEGRTGLCALLNEECVRPKGSGAGFVNKALAENHKSPCLVVNKTDRLSFGINHYAGEVFYAAEDFVTSNMDTLPTDLQECVTECSNVIISKAFKEDNEAEMEMSKSSRRNSTPRRGKSNIMAPTVWTKYKGQLAHLMTDLRATNSRYIRCIKPNTQKKPYLLEHNTTAEQLRFAGIVAGVTISRSAFPNRLKNSIAYARYKFLWDDKKYPSQTSASMSELEKLRADCEAVLTCALKSKEVVENGKLVKAFLIGKTRTYFRAGALEFWEGQRVGNEEELRAEEERLERLAREERERQERLAFEAAKREQALREEAERKARLAQETAEQDAKFQEEMDVYNREIAMLKNRLQQEEEKTKSIVSQAEKRAATVEAERDELDRKTNEIIESGILASKKELEMLQIKLASNVKLIQFLRKENKKTRKSLAKQDELMNDVSDKNQMLSDRCNASATSFNAMEGDNETIFEKNERLLDKWQEAKDENTHLKEQVRKEQAKYMDIAEQRLEFQKTLARVLNMIQDNCKNKTLVEHVFCIGHETETEAKSIMAVLESDEPSLGLISDASDSSSMSLSS